MIPAGKWPLFEAWFAGHVRRRLRCHFEEVRAFGLDPVRTAVAQGPLVVVSNHVAWWDPLVLIWLAHHILRVDGYAIMDATNLRARPYFRRVGAIGVERGSARDGAAVLRHAATLLVRSRRMVWVYPQGEERPMDERPLRFQPGAARIASLAGCPLLPCAVRYEQGPTEHPLAWLHFGAPLCVGSDAALAMEEAQRRVSAGLDQLAAVRRAVNDPGGEVLLRRPIGRAGLWAERCLARLAR